MPKGRPGIRRKPIAEAMEEKTLRLSCGCWLWLGCHDKDGYGFIRIEGKNKKAHRVSYEMKHGALGKFLACHSCDTPECINPDHIFPGTNGDNQRDSARKGRNAGLRNFKNGKVYT